MLEHPGTALLANVPTTGLERSMADTDAERLVALAAELILDVWDPYRIPLHLLPYLAWAMGVNYWDDDWSETTKRTWVARQWEFKAIRGTLAGSRMAIDYAGRDVTPFGYQLLGATVPPQRVFSGPSLTREEREAWLATMPQLRVWQTYEHGIAPEYKSFYGGETALRLRSHRFCLLGAAPIPSDALSRLHRRARWVVNGVETETRVTELGAYWQLHLRGLAGFKVFTKFAIRPDRFFIPSDAYTRLVTITPSPRLSWRSIVGPSVEPVTAEPEQIFEQGTRGFAVYSDLPVSPRAYFIPSMAWKRIFQRFAVIPGSVVGRIQRRSPVQFMGVGRYGFPKYTAWLRVSLRSKRSRFAAGDGLMLPKSRFWIPHDNSAVERGRTAVQASKRLVDNIMLDLGPVYRFVAGRPFHAGMDNLIVGRP